MSVVLNLPTIFPLFITSLIHLDMYLAGTCIVLITLLVLVGNLLADIGAGVGRPAHPIGLIKVLWQTPAPSAGTVLTNLPKIRWIPWHRSPGQV